MKRSSHSSSLSPIGEALARVLGDRGLTGTGTVGKLMTGWAEAVGDGVATHSSPDSLKGTTLYLVVDSSAWMNQLSMLRLTLAARINAYLGEEAVEDVRFRVGKVETTGARKSRAEFRPRRRKLTPSEASAIEDAVAAIGDDGIRASARRLIMADYSTKKHN